MKRNKTKAGKIKALSIMLTLILTITLLAPLAGVKASAAVGDSFDLALEGTPFTLRYRITQEPSAATADIGSVEITSLRCETNDLEEGTLDVVIPDRVTRPGTDNHYWVTAIGDTELFGYSIIGSVTLPERLTYIEERAFIGAGYMTSLVAPGVEEIGDNAFSYCADLTYVELGYSLKTVGTGAFSNCTSLEEVVFKSKDMESLGADVFKGCTNLKAVYILKEDEFTVSTGVLGTGSNAYVFTPRNSALYEKLYNLGMNVRVFEHLSDTVNTNSLRLSAVSYEYDGTAKEPELSYTYNHTGWDLGEFGHTLSYYRDGVLTDDLFSPGVIEIRMKANNNAFYGTVSAFYEITARSLMLIAREKALSDGQSATGSGSDVIALGLADGHQVETLSITAANGAVIPSAAVIKNAAGEDVSANYKINYIDSAAYVGDAKSLSSIAKGEDGNYTLTFGDGSTFLLEIPKAQASVDEPVSGDVSDTPTEPDSVAEEQHSPILSYVSLCIGGVSLAGVIALLVIVLKKKRI